MGVKSSIISAVRDHEFEVNDQRKGRFGVVHLSDWDSDSFRGLTAAQRCVYVTLCMFVGRYTNKCFPKVSTMIQITGFSRATVFRALAELERVDLIERSKRFITPARRVNLYTLR